MDNSGENMVPGLPGKDVKAQLCADHTDFRSPVTLRYIKRFMKVEITPRKQNDEIKVVVTVP